MATIGRTARSKTISRGRKQDTAASVANRPAIGVLPGRPLQSKSNDPAVVENHRRSRT